jgi:tRNA-(ms[2]io[6]A)-hydroxylase
MSLEIQLQTQSSPEWWPFVQNNFDEFLLDHASCERKASAVGLQFVSNYPEKIYLIEPMLNFAREELLHFHQVIRLILNRGLQPKGEKKDPYINALLQQVRHSPEERFLDRLLIFAIVEKRGTERFGIVGESHPDDELRHFYGRLAEAEARHHELFLGIAAREFSIELIRCRLRELERAEAQILRDLPLRAAVH